MRLYNSGETAGNRNVAWFACGVEKDGFINWVQPEVVLYNENPLVGASYPDFIEERDRFFLPATQKSEARVIEVKRKILEDLRKQDIHRAAAREGLVLELAGKEFHKKSRD